jgi:hypothetical protein
MEISSADTSCIELFWFLCCGMRKNREEGGEDNYGRKGL